MPACFYGAIMPEFPRIARCALLYQDFLKSAIALFNRMVNQGGSEIQILKQISKGVSRRPVPFSKLCKNAKQIRDDISYGNI